MSKPIPDPTRFARKLRRHATLAERKAWDMLRNRRMLGYKFRRQHVLGSYVADFYCSELKLVIEIDGSIHSTLEQARWDRERDAAMRAAGLRVIRIRNEDVSSERLEAVVKSARRSTQL